MVTGVIKGIRRRFQLPCQKKKPLNPKDFDILLTCITEKGNLDSLAKKLSIANTCLFKNVIRKKKVIKKNK